ncbi:MAG: MerR family transcriptional regulator [Clostridium perfringens]|nr:MerR family transcriptional regulator [Clostridium perfringens]
MKKYYKIGEMSKIYGIGKDSLIYYEELGVIKPIRDSNGYRLYDIKDAWKFNLIKELRELNISMKRIKEYLENRSIESTKDILKQEMKIIDDEIVKLVNNKNNIEKRLNTIETVSNDLVFDKIQVITIKERGILKLDIDNINEVSCVIKMLQKEYENLFYILGNNKIGITYNTENIVKNNEVSYKDAFYIVGDSEPYDNKLNESSYVTYTYKGNYNKDTIYINNMLSFIEKNNYKITGDIIKICKINIHETDTEEEFISEIQIPINLY